MPVAATFHGARWVVTVALAMAVCSVGCSVDQASAATRLSVSSRVATADRVVRVAGRVRAREGRRIPKGSRAVLEVRTAGSRSFRRVRSGVLRAGRRAYVLRWAAPKSVSALRLRVAIRSKGRRVGLSPTRSVRITSSSSPPASETGPVAPVAPSFTPGAAADAPASNPAPGASSSPSPAEPPAEDIDTGPTPESSTRTGFGATAVVRPDRTTVVAVEGYRLEIPAGTVKVRTTASIALQQPTGPDFVGPRARFSIGGSWADGRRRVRVTLPIDPDLEAVTSANPSDGYLPVLALGTTDQRVQVFHGRDVEISADGETVSTSLTRLGDLVSSSMPEIARLPSGATDGEYARRAVGAFRGLRAMQPTCRRDRTNDPTAMTRGDALDAQPALGGRSPVRYCIEARSNGNFAWRISNDAGTTLRFRVPNRASVVDLDQPGNPFIHRQSAAVNQAAPHMNAAYTHDVEVPPAGDVVIEVPSDDPPTRIEISGDSGAANRSLAILKAGEPMPDDGAIFRTGDELGDCGRLAGANTAGDVADRLACLRDEIFKPRAAATALQPALLVLRAVHRGDIAVAQPVTPVAMTLERRSDPTVDGPGPAVAIDGSGSHRCVARRNLTLDCWGSNNEAALGRGDDSTTPWGVPAPVVDLADAKQVTGGAFHTCALRVTGGVACWGYDPDGRLGRGDPDTYPGTRDNRRPSSVVNLHDAIDVDAGESHTCAVRSTGNVVCWGNNDHGQLGIGPTDGSDQASPQEVRAVDDATQVSAGYAHTCALRSGGTVVCWGKNYLGQVGDGTTEERTTPVPVVGLRDVVQIAAGSDLTCARRADGSVACWGAGGRVGDGSEERRTTPTNLRGLSDIADLDAGSFSACAVERSGQAWCWGERRFGAVGDRRPDGPDALEPSRVSGLTNAVSVRVGFAGACATRTAGQPVCWGVGTLGELGIGPTGYGPDGTGPGISTTSVNGPVQVQSYLDR